MKHFYTLLILIFGLQLGFGQLGFEREIIFGLNFFIDADPYFPADIDGDGDMDMLSASTWYENLNGQGKFGVRNVFSEESGDLVFAADFDGDNDLDVLSQSGTKVRWFQNLDGLGTFSDEILIDSSLGNIRSIKVGDIDNDGDIDVLVGSLTLGEALWYENLDGQGNFGDEQIISDSISSLVSLEVADLDGDGDLDIASISQGDDKLVWFENTDGQGNFGGEQIIALNLTYVYNSIHIADIDNDGDMDIFMKNELYENLDGQGTFSGAQDIIPNGTILNSADMDNDGDLDLIVSSTQLKWYENLNGNGAMSQIPVSNIADHDSEGFPFIVDLDGDGDLDVTTNNQWHENLNGLGIFEYDEPNIIIFTPGFSDILSKDIDNDGDNDILTTSLSDGKIAWFENQDGLGSFSTPKLIKTNADLAFTAFIADLDGDNDMDVLASSDHRIVWFKNLDGSGNFGPDIVINSEAYFARNIFVCDLDGDNDNDIVYSVESGNKIIWHENLDGEGDFGAQQYVVENEEANIVRSADIDGDGDLDILSGSHIGIFWFENLDGQGVFGPKIIIDDDIWTTKAFIKDIDNDGFLDVITNNNSNGNIVWFKNLDGVANFGNGNVIAEGLSYRDMSVADLDSDGDLDIAVALSQDDDIVWFENVDGLGAFGQEQLVHHFGSPSGADLYRSIVCEDIDNDGKVDIVSDYQSNWYMHWFKNLGELRNEINGVLSLDVNNNGCADGNINLSDVLISTESPSESFATFSSETGAYQFFVGEDTYTTTVNNLPSYYSISPNSATSTFSGLQNTDTVNFCLETSADINDLNISIYSSQTPRQFINITYYVVYRNVGTNTLDGSITFDYEPDKLEFLNAGTETVVDTGNSIVLEFEDLDPLETRILPLEFFVTATIFDTITLTGTIHPVNGDLTPDDNTFELFEPVVGPYDPNDIRCLQGDEILIDDVGNYLNYIIRFQNIGTASAINVRVDHQLDDKLDWTTMQLESLSHQGRVEITNGNFVQFIFDEINLPHSDEDEEGSNGYVAYKIKPKADVQVGDIISGVADIYFDFNPPITTNTVNTEIVEPLSVDEVELQNVKLFPNPAQNKLQITFNQIIDGLTIVDINGRELNSIEISVSDYSLDVSGLSNGVYFLEIQSGESKSTKKFIKN
ncbi:T9SS type A sorting domain-containing protein [Winogradskyella ouciana]|uniref:T9SS type A sorting domain-containing protein n=1 Tax=Winogradskyella ouciana TaxID=2608631 RepID=A0A7K1G810_9FLAO|nr:T9SS type A sorting domain-containing protein [Winogradskyella ouciana]MTE25422.1 T9SS type A sorting domain-containing protein [Winogradskyella ouciana]